MDPHTLEHEEWEDAAEREAKRVRYVQAAMHEQSMGRPGKKDYEVRLPVDADALTRADFDTRAEWDALHPYLQYVSTQWLSAQVAEKLLPETNAYVLKPSQGGLGHVEAEQLTEGAGMSLRTAGPTANNPGAGMSLRTAGPTANNPDAGMSLRAAEPTANNPGAGMSLRTAGPTANNPDAGMLLRTSEPTANHQVVFSLSGALNQPIWGSNHVNTYVCTSSLPCLQSPIRLLAMSFRGLGSCLSSLVSHLQRLHDMGLPAATG